MHEFEIQGSSISIISAMIVFFAAIMMVSNIKYRSFKDFDVKSRVPFVVLVGVVMIFSLIYFDPPRVLFLMAAGFALSGPLAWVFRYRKGQEKWEHIMDEADDDEGSQS